MKGGIYSDQRCSVCGGAFKHFEPKGLWCKDHPGNSPTRFVVRFGELTKRFKDYESAYRFLTGIRYETDQGKYDIRDYRRDNPLGFENLTRKFLYAKRKNKAVNKYKQRLRFAVDQWQNRNVKEIGFADIEDLLNELIEKGYSSYYVHHISNTLKTFWR